MRFQNLSISFKGEGILNNTSVCPLKKSGHCSAHTELSPAMMAYMGGVS